MSFDIVGNGPPTNPPYNPVTSGVQYLDQTTGVAYVSVNNGTGSAAWEIMATTEANAIALQGTPILPTPPTANQILKFDGAHWVPATASTGNATAIQGVPVSSTAPTNGQVLKYDGSSYVPSSTNATQIQSVNVSSSAPTDAQVISYVAAHSQYEPTTINLSGNATQLQGRTISGNAPTNAQVLTWNSANSDWEPAPASGGGPNNYNVVFASDFIWNQTDVAGSIGNLASPGQHTLTLNPCPAGLDGTTQAADNNRPFFVYIYGTGTPEVVQVTNGTCPSHLSSPSGTGTIVVTTTNAHSAGFTVGTASTGIQEAVNSQTLSGQFDTAKTYPVVKLGVRTSNYQIRGSVYLHEYGMVLDGTGSLIECFTRDRCIYVGQNILTTSYAKLYNITISPALQIDGAQISSVSKTNGVVTVTTASAHPFLTGDSIFNWFDSANAGASGQVAVVTVIDSVTYQYTIGSGSFASSPGTFGFAGLLNCAIEVNSEGTVLQDINVINSPNFTNSYFSFGIVNDNDQSCVIERYANRASNSVKTTANFPMASHIFQRGDQGNAGIIYLNNSEISLQCSANGVYNNGGNSFSLDNTVIQGGSVFHLVYNAGLQPAIIRNNYQESTGCVNPLYNNALGTNKATMGTMINGQTAVFEGTVGGNQGQGFTPIFASGGATTINYYVVPHGTSGFANGYGCPMYIGSATPSSGAVTVHLQWPSVSNTVNGTPVGTQKWDILAYTGAGSPPWYPNATGNWAVAIDQVIAPSTNGMLTFDDTQAAYSSYTVHPQTVNFNIPFFWPADLVLTGTAHAFVDRATYAGANVSTQGGTAVSVFAKSAMPGTAWKASPMLISSPDALGTIFVSSDNSNNSPGGVKGRINFWRPGNLFGFNAVHLITLVDSQYGKTATTPNQRPSWDATDAYIGLDNGGNAVSIGANGSISHYITNVGDNTSWKERVTSTAKLYAVPLVLNEQSAPSGTANATVLYADSGTHILKANYNNTGFLKIPQVIASGTLALGTGVINSGACASAVTASATGTTTSSVVQWSFASDPSAVNGYGGSTTGAVLNVYAYPTSNTANIKVCNNTSGSITPAAISVNWSVIQ